MRSTVLRPSNGSLRLGHEHGLLDANIHRADGWSCAAAGKRRSFDDQHFCAELSPHTRQPITAGRFSSHIVLDIASHVRKQAQEDGHAFVAPTRVKKSKFKSGIRADQTIRIEKPTNNLERRLRRLRRLLALR